MDAIEVRVDNVNLIEVEFEPGQTAIEIAANFNPVIEVKEFDYPQELVLVNQRISQILQTEGRLVEWGKSPTHIQYRYAGDSEWVDLVPLAEIKGDKGDPQTRDDLGLGITHNPEFADIQVTPLQSDADGGGVASEQALWLGATPKSTKSWIAKIVGHLFGSIFVQPVDEAGTFQLALTHLYKGVRVNSAADCLCNVPTNATVAFPIGSIITLEQLGTGVITATAVSGVTLNGDPKTQGQYKFIQLWKTTIDTWVVIGGTA